MKKQLMIILLGFLLVSSCNNNKKKGIDNLKTGVKNTFIEIMDEEALKLVDSNATIQTLANRGVKFEICANTIRGKKIDKNKINLNATVVPSGVARVADLQQRGYVYVKP